MKDHRGRSLGLRRKGEKKSCKVATRTTMFVPTMFVPTMFVPTMFVPILSIKKNPLLQLASPKNCTCSRGFKIYKTEKKKIHTVSDEEAQNKPPGL